MFYSALTIISAAICSTIAKPALPIPTTGTYRIQNAATGLFLDASGGSQDLGNPVLAQTLNEPLTGNQEWNIARFGNSAGGVMQSISSYVTATIQDEVVLNPSAASGLVFRDVQGGVAICLAPETNDCFTSPSTALSQVFVSSFTGALDQVWIFESAD